MEIIKRIQVINNKECFEYSITLEENVIDTIEKYGHKVPTKKEEERYYNFIKFEIPYDERVISKHFQNRYGEISFCVYTKAIKDLELENWILNELNGKLNLGLWENGVDVKDNSVRLDAHCRYNKENLNKICETINAKDFEVIFNSHMEEVYLVLEL